MSKRVNPFRQLTPRQQRAIKARIERIAPEIQMGMSAQTLIVALFEDLATVPRMQPKRNRPRNPN